MPLKLNVGVSRKIGLPEFSSVGASCFVEVELDSSLLQNDLDGFHDQVRGAFVAAQQAVNDELARLQAPPGAHGNVPGGREPRNVSSTHSSGVPGRNHGARGRTSKPATANQVRAILAITQRQRADLPGVLHDGYGVGRPEDLTLAQASEFIDQLKAASVA